MSKKSEPKAKTIPPDAVRKYEADTLGIQALRLIAAPNPKDDLSDADLEKVCREQRQSSEMIRYLIDFVKKL